jgi:predicted nucleic acid-binding protein
MPKKYFLDTCIWRDFYEDRTSKSGRPLGKEAARLVAAIIKRKDVILYAESVVRELKKDYDGKAIDTLLRLLFLTGTLKRTDITKEEHLEAKELAQARGLPYIDCLHAVLAKHHCAQLVSQDRHLIDNLKDVTTTKRPAELT